MPLFSGVSLTRIKAVPIYEYECNNCGHRLEAIQKVNDAPLQSCPECEGSLRKLVSAAAFHLKGSGWYVTDFKDKPKKSQDKKKDATGDQKTDAKPAEKSETAPADTGSKDSGSKKQPSDSS